MKAMSLVVTVLLFVLFLRVAARCDNQQTIRPSFQPLLGNNLQNKSDTYELKSLQGQTSQQSLSSQPQWHEQRTATKSWTSNKQNSQLQDKDSDKIIHHTYYWSSPDGRASSFSQSWISPSGNTSGSMMQQHFNYQTNSLGNSKEKLSLPNPSLHWKLPGMVPFLWRQQQLFQQQNNNLERPLQ